MSSKHSIRFEGLADFSDITKEIDGLNSHIQEAFGKKGAKVVDKESITSLKKETHGVFANMQKDMEKLKKEAKDLQKVLKDTKAGDKANAQYSNQLLENTKKTLALKQQMRDVTNKSNRLAALEQGDGGGQLIPFPGKKRASAGGMVKNTVVGGISEIAGHTPALSEAASVGQAAVGAGQAASSAGLSTLAIGGLTILAAAAAGAAVAIQRMSSGFEAYKATTSNVLALSGMGATPMEAGSRGANLAAQMGYNSAATMDLQKGVNRSFGHVSAGDDENRMGNILTASRGMGISPGEIISGGNQLRQTGGTDAASKQMAMILDKAITSGMDKSQASMYLASAVGLLSELNQSGVTNSSALLATMAGLVGNKNMSPEMAAKSIGGLSSAISGSSGESNAFFQSAAARAGLGGGTIMGSQFAVRQGLAGVDTGAMNGMVGDTAMGRTGMSAMKGMGLGSSDFSQKFAGSILGELKQRFDTSSPEGAQSAMGFTNQMFGGKTAADATKTWALLEKISKSGTSGLGDEDKKLLSSLSQDPESAWRDKTLTAMEKTALYTEQVAAWSSNAQVELGKASSPIFNTLTEVLTKLDTHLAGSVGSVTGADSGSVGEILTNLEGVASDIGSEIVAAGRQMADDFVEGLSSWWSSTSIGKLLEGSSAGFGGGDLMAKGSDVMGQAMDAVAEGVKSLFGGDTASSDGKSSADAQLAEQKKTNTLLQEAIRKSLLAPKTGRETTRLHIK